MDFFKLKVQTLRSGFEILVAKTLVFLWAMVNATLYIQIGLETKQKGGVPFQELLPIQP